MSRFLPKDFDPKRPVALIAGRGRYPELLLERLRAAGLAVRLVAFEGETAPELEAKFSPGEVRRIKVGQLGHMIDALKEFAAGSAVMAGQISPRKLFKGLHPDLKAVMIMATLKERNAETIFGAIAREVGKAGVLQLDARVFLDDQLATPGCMTGGGWFGSGIDDDSLAHGVRIARECARLDIGQGVVVARGTVVAVEAFEGTDKMLRRCADYGAEDMLFVKTVKPAQDYRFDVPCFGLLTLESLAAGGIRRAALEAGSVLMLDRAAVIARAKALGITLYGFDAAKV